MSYCRFENTVADLADCYDHLYDEDLSEYESAARKRLIALCHDIVFEVGDDDLD